MYHDAEEATTAIDQNLFPGPHAFISGGLLFGMSSQGLDDIPLRCLFQSFSQNTDDFLIATDLKGIIRSTSANIELLMSSKPAVFQGTHIRNLFCDGRGHATRMMETTEIGQGWESRELVLKRMDGNTLHVTVSTSLLADGDRGPVGILFLIRDITEKRELEEKLRHAQKMEAIGTLAGGIAHDFNNLLTGIQGYVSLMLLDVPPGHPQGEMLRSIGQQVASGADLTRKLLGFAKGGKYEVKTTDMNELVRRSAKLFGRTRKEIKIHGKYAESLWTTEVDTSQIEHVLLNLYINAWQAMPEGGDLHLATENVRLDTPLLKPYPSVKPGRYVQISVTDNGSGMDEETQHRAFEPFFTTKERSRGTGLGLASAYGIVKSHGGLIKVASQMGRGTTVTFYLPASEKAVTAEERAPQQRMRRGSGTLLLIEDEAAVAEVTAELLETVGYRVLTAQGGQEGIALFRRHRSDISLVLLDMIMPGLTGRETFDLLKELDPEVRVILTSGYALHGQAREILGKGCRGFIQKPYDIQKLSGKIAEVLEQ